VQGQICDILRPKLAMNRFLPLWPYISSHFGYINLGGRAWGGSDIRSMSSIRPICKCRCPPLILQEFYTLCLTRPRICIIARSPQTNLQRSPFTGKFFKVTTFALPSMSLILLCQANMCICMHPVPLHSAQPMKTA
jgi:hypothetical protein